MNDLVISYDNENDERITKKYELIYNFTDDMESLKQDIPKMNYKNVDADFWENPLHHKHFETIAYLYQHCKNILR